MLTLALRRQLHRPQRVLERHWVVARSGFIWVLLGGFFEPFFYLISTDLGFGSVVDDVSVGSQVVPYAHFVAPALMAVSAMNGALYETMNVFFRINYDRSYAAMLATPVTPADVVVGDVSWSALRGLIYALVFYGIMALMGMTSSWWGLLMVPVAGLIAVAFGSVGMVVATYMRSIADFDYVPTAMLPLFLFSATFFPVDQYGRFAWLLALSPLYHGVAVLRDLNLGELSWSMLGHLAVLVVLAGVCFVWATKRLQKALLS